MHQKRGCNGAPAVCISLNDSALLVWLSGFPPQAFLVADFLDPVLSGCLLESNSNPFPGSALQTPHQHPAPPCPHRCTHLSGWGVQACGTDHLCRSHSVLPATDQWLHSPPVAPEAPLLSQLTSPLVRGLPWMREPPLPFSSPRHGHRSLPSSSHLPFPFFLSSYLVMQGSFLSF